MDAKLARIRELIDLKEQTDRELAELITGTAPQPTKAARKIVKCSNCGETGHNASTCKSQPADAGHTNGHAQEETQYGHTEL